MNFWARQTAVRKKSKLFFVSFFLVLIFCALVPYLLIYSGITFFHYSGSADISYLKTTLLDGLKLWKHPIFYITAIIIGIPIIAGAIVQMFRLLRDSGKRIADMLNGTPIPQNTHDFYQRRLLYIVEEMSIASGVPIPRVFMLENEPGINALVAGKTSHHAVLCVTRGACELLKRDELQGVIAHEYSHLLNGDMAFHTLMLGVLHGFFLSIKTGRKLDIASGDSGNFLRDMLFMIVQMGALVLLLPLWLWLYGMIFGTIGKMLKSAFSRSREYLADACAVQFTRYPKGLADAMKKIGALPRGQIIRRSGNLELSHFFFSDGTPPPLMFSLYPSHPPLKKRIKLLDSDFDGIFPQVDRKKLKKEIYELRDKIHHADDILAAGVIMECDIPRQLRIDSLVNRFGTFDKNDIDQTGKIIKMIPLELYEMTKTSEQATALIYTLLTDTEDQEVRKAQLNLLREQCSSDVMITHSKASALLDEKIYYHMILIELSLPALRTLSPKTYDGFRTICRHLILMDNRLTPYEYALTTSLSIILDPFFGFDEKKKTKVMTVEQQASEFALLLSMMARCGADDEAGAKEAFEAGIKVLPWKNLNLKLQLLEPFDPDTMTDAIKSLSGQPPQRKKHIIDACMITIGADLVIKPVEWDILRSFAMMLECPLPLLPPSLGQIRTCNTLDGI